MIRNFLESHPVDKDQLHARLDEMDARLMHIEDSLIDYRDVMVKLVKQGNSIVGFLKDISVPGMEQEMSLVPASTETDEQNDAKQKFFEDLAKEFETKVKKLTKLEKELRKYKDQITPGQVGDA